MAKASIYARTDKEVASKVPVYIRFTHRGERARMSLDLRVKESDWNSNKRRVRGSHLQSEYLNQYLSDVQAAAEGAVVERSHPGPVGLTVF